MTKCRLISMPNLTPSYDNSITCYTYDAKMKYFDSQPFKEVELNMKRDGARDFIVVKEDLHDLRQYDYLYYIGNDRTYFYFITEKAVEVGRNTRLYIELDVWVTYYHECDFLDSFIDRCHQDRWIDGDFPALNTVDENLDYGEIIQHGDPETIFKFNDSIIITSSVPLGKVEKGGSDGGGGVPGGGGDCWEQGKLSAKGFRFIKGFEGYAPREYQDSSGYWTICYGVTKHGEPNIYTSLASKQPVDEEEGAKVSYKLKNENYGSKIINAVKSYGCNNQNQFDALLSLAYNGGTGLVTGDNRLTQVIKKDPNNESAIRPVWESFATTSDGQQLPGLVARRKEECNLYFGKSAEMRPIEIIGGSGTVTTNNGNGWLPDD